MKQGILEKEKQKHSGPRNALIYSEKKEEESNGPIYTENITFSYTWTNRKQPLKHSKTGEGECNFT